MERSWKVAAHEAGPGQPALHPAVLGRPDYSSRRKPPAAAAEGAHSGRLGHSCGCTGNVGQTQIDVD